MTSQPGQFFGDVTAIGKISDFLSQPAGIQFDRLAAAGDHSAIRFCKR